MNGKCFEIGTLQAFLDGEIAPEVSIRVADHVAECGKCAQMLAIAEEESSFVFAALEREMNTLVPTQRLWTRINESIAVERSNKPVWIRALAFFSLPLASPSFAAAAGIVVVLGLFAILWNPSSLDVDYTAGNRPGPDRPGDVGRVAVVPPLDNGPSGTVASIDDDSPSRTAADPIQVKVTKYKPEELRRIVVNATQRAEDKPQPQYAVYRDAYLPGEESYVKTISNLRENVEGQKEEIFTPSTRISFERDMAVVDDSIKKMRAVVRKNPRNQAARQVLYSSYQDKIDLLNSVAQREELMASIR